MKLDKQAELRGIAHDIGMMVDDIHEDLNKEVRMSIMECYIAIIQQKNSIEINKVGGKYD